MFISYRSVVTAIVTVVVLAAFGTYLFWPGASNNSLTDRIMLRLGLAQRQKSPATIGPQQAHFTALDGTVRVKKANSNSWVTADFGVPLEKGDVVQTSSQGMAKVFFFDGTSYTVKPDSLIVVEENSANEQQQTLVSVQVTTGTVDLATATYAQGSSSQVVVAGATASLSPESSAVVHNDPSTDVHEILLKKGSGQVTRKNETVMLSNFERVSFKAEAPQMTRTKEPGPPTLITPANMMVVYLPGAGRTIHFSWAPTGTSGSYRLRVSRNLYFSSTLFDQVVQGTEVDLPVSAEGAYYWVVTPQDASGRETAESERNQFTLVFRTGDSISVPLELESFVQHGHMLEIKGKTDPNARVMVNGQEVPIIRADGSFAFFTKPLPTGESMITVTAQNSKGGVKTQQKKVVVP
jgi:hypothetical protein